MTGSDPNWGVAAGRTRRLREAEFAVRELADKIRDGRRTPEDRRIQQACADVYLVAEFVARSSNTEMDEKITAKLRRDEEYTKAFSKIHLKIDEFSSSLVAVDLDGPSDDLCAKLSGLATDVRQGLDQAVQAFVAVVDEETASDRQDATRRGKALRIASSTREQLNARRLLDQVQQERKEAQQARDEAVRAAEASQQAAGKVGSGRLAGHYDEYAKDQLTMADRLRWMAGVTLLLITGVDAAFDLLSGDFSINGQLSRIYIVIPLAVLAGYLARESSKHRVSAKWSAELATALHTLEAYIAPLDNSEQRELRRVLGMRVFSATGAPADSTEQPDAGLYADLERLLERVEKFVSRVRETAEPRSPS